MLAKFMRDCLLTSGQLESIRSPQNNIIFVNDFILRSVNNKRSFYLQTDIINFGEQFDIEIGKKILLKKLENYIDSDDIQLFTNVSNSFRKTNGRRASGSPIDQLLCEVMLSQFNNRLSNFNKELVDNYFVRFGEDMVFAFSSQEECFAMYSALREIVKNELGNNCNIHDMSITEPYPKRFSRWGVPVMYGKCSVGQFDRHGLDFCGYHYSIDHQKNILVGIRNSTMEKIADRIREYTEGGNIRYRRLPSQLNSNGQIRKMINSLNELFGFHYNGTKFEFSNQYGISPLFCLPKGMDNRLIRSQAMRLNHYMLRRLRHLHLRNVPDDMNRNWREEIDKGYRKIGLRSVMDGINKADNII